MRTGSLALMLMLLTADGSAQALVAPAAAVEVPAASEHDGAATRDTAASVPVFRTAVDVVALNVVVTDREQRFVTGLGAGDFAVYEDGVQQEVSFFAATQVPLDLALLLDTSASMHDKMDTMQQAALGFLATLRGDDRTAVVEIKDVVRISYPLGGDVEAAKQAVRAATARGGTALYNGLYLGIKEMVKLRKTTGEVRRQAIAVFSDGEDTASLVGYEDVMDEAKRAGISIYTITLKSAGAVRQAQVPSRRYFSQAEFAMKALAQETGARAFFPTHINELAAVYTTIAEELANQYAIGYTPRNGARDGGFRRVIVRIADRPDARTRTRTGYVAARAPASH